MEPELWTVFFLSFFFIEFWKCSDSVVFLFFILLAYLTQKVMWRSVFTFWVYRWRWRHLSSKISILIHTKLGRTATWVVFTIWHDFCYIWKFNMAAKTNYDFWLPSILKIVFSETACDGIVPWYECSLYDPLKCSCIFCRSEIHDGRRCNIKFASWWRPPWQLAEFTWRCFTIGTWKTKSQPCFYIIVIE